MPAPYYIYVNGEANCKVPHKTITEARKEAVRLFALVDFKKRVKILETIEVIEPQKVSGALV